MAAAASVAAIEQHRRLDAYVPRIVLRLLLETPGARFRALDATMLFADISGFTRLSERLARSGREGAEELAETIGGCLSSLLAVAHQNGGELLKIGGDALLLLFKAEGHADRACRAAVDMRRRLRDVGRLPTSAGNVTLRMSQGVHSGEFHLFLVGESHRELLLAGPAPTAGVGGGKAAGGGGGRGSCAPGARPPRPRPGA